MSDDMLAENHIKWFDDNFPSHLFNGDEREELMLYTWLAWRDSYRIKQQEYKDACDAILLARASK